MYYCPVSQTRNFANYLARYGRYFCFAFINIWNELFLAVMLLMSPDKMTVPVALNSFISKAGISWDTMSAGIIIALLPTMIVFGIGQKYIVAGLTEGSVKE